MEARRNSRKVAVQAIFQFFFSKEDISKILDEFCSYRIKETRNYKKKYDIDFFQDIVIGVYKNEKKIIKFEILCSKCRQGLDSQKTKNELQPHLGPF